jgi:hypothetical protein
MEAIDAAFQAILQRQLDRTATGATFRRRRIRLLPTACKSRMVEQSWRERLQRPNYVRPGEETQKAFMHPLEPRGPLRRTTAAASILRGRDDIAIAVLFGLCCRPPANCGRLKRCLIF